MASPPPALSPNSTISEALTPLTFREFSIAAPLLALAIWFGVYPTALLKYMQPSVDQTVTELADWTKDNEPARLVAPAATDTAANRPVRDISDL